MSQIVCQLDDFHLSRLHLDWTAAEDETKVQAKLNFGYDVATHAEKKFRYRLTLRVSVDAKSGLGLDAEIVGFFTLPEDMPPERRATQIRINGCTILYGILRGQVAMATGSFPSGKISLPAVMMQDVVAAVEKRRAKARKTKAQAKPAPARRSARKKTQT